VAVQGEGWASLGFDLEALAHRVLACAVFQDMPCEVSVLFTRDDDIAQLNGQYRQKPKPTNVLSFPSGMLDASWRPEGEPLFLGDIAVAFGVIEREAQEQGKSFQDHLTHLLIHGLLHLQGYDHETPEEAEEMESLEIQLLQQYFSIKNPYVIEDASLC
jgi:probable rRNA maturation factor